MFPVVDVADWEVVDEEAGGDTVKRWVVEPGGSTRWLFKQTTIKEIPARGGGTRPYRHGGDWAEKICSELAAGMALPAARIELASWRNEMPGVISRNVRPSGSELHGGGILLRAIDQRYRGKTASHAAANRIGHSLDNIRALLEAVAPPPDAPDEMSAFDVFTGYLLFDAFVANPDRHEMNWAVLRSPRGGSRSEPVLRSRCCTRIGDGGLASAALRRAGRHRRVVSAGNGPPVRGSRQCQPGRFRLRSHSLREPGRCPSLGPCDRGHRAVEVGDCTWPDRKLVG